ncbi:MAG: hypothetical protein JWQ79_388 [Mucilaginibacter sp.]|jgi:hypothetical protein|nr:hypothetical protein [Mucilaginibacter sp.]
MLESLFFIIKLGLGRYRFAPLKIALVKVLVRNS